MDISTKRVASYAGAGAITGAGFAMLRHGMSPGIGTLGVMTGVAAAAAQTYVENRTGSSELGWLASIGAGAASGVLLLGGVNSGGQGFMHSRGIGAVIGISTGVFAPMLAGMLLAQIEGAPA